jgi:hypothetical protein
VDKDFIKGGRTDFSANWADLSFSGVTLFLGDKSFGNFIFSRLRNKTVYISISLKGVFITCTMPNITTRPESHLVPQTDSI